jgi:hypothetical protein
VTALAALAALALAECKGSKATGPAGPAVPSGAFRGTLVGSSAGGVLTLNFPAALQTAARRARFTIVPVADAASVAAATTMTGSLAITGGPTYTLTGAYDPNATPQLTVSGGGYTITGNYSSATGQITGNFSGPNGDSGQWTVSAGVVKVFCGTYATTAGGTGTGTWNLTLDSSNRLFGVANTPNGASLLQGSYDAASGNVAVTFHRGSASGTVNASNGSGSGTWSASSSNGTQSGTWTATIGGC